MAEAMHSRRTWWGFGITLFLIVVLVVAGTLHVALRWEPRLLGEVEHGEWMEFETFRVRIDRIEIADSFPSSFEGSEPIEARTVGMKLLLVRFSVERQDPAPESLSEDDNAVCRITIFNKDGLTMDETGFSSVADSPTSTGCSPSSFDEDDDRWGDELSFQSQRVVAVTPDPISTFTLQVEHLQDDAGDRWLSRTG